MKLNSVNKINWLLFLLLIITIASCSNSKKTTVSQNTNVNNGTTTNTINSNPNTTKDLNWYYANCPFKMPIVTLPKFNNKNFSIADYGGINDGKTLNTAAFASVINACATSGGGNVIVPEGIWLTAPIQLQSNINLVVQKGATIQFTKDRTQFPIIKASNTSTNYQTASPIYGYNLTNVAITGEGVIDGGGESWRPIKKDKLTDIQWNNLIKSGGVLSDDQKIWWPSAQAKNGESLLKELKKQNGNLTASDYIPVRDFLRPNLLFLSNCENILIDKITIRNSPKFLFYPNNCKNLSITNAHFLNEWNAQNGDALDISASKNVVIYNTTVSAGDDAICMKSSRGKNDAATDFNLENVLIAGCTVYRGHGGFVIGSNTDGGMKNIYVKDCNFIGTDIGVRVKSNAGRGGAVKDIYIENIYMKNIIKEAILFDTYYEDVPAGANKSTTSLMQDKTPQFSNFKLKNIYCNGAEKAISITGLPQMPIKDIYIDSTYINAKNSVIATDASNIFFTNIQILSPNNIVYKLNNVQGFNINNGFFPTNAKTFVIADKNSTNIKVENTDLHNNKNAIELN